MSLKIPHNSLSIKGVGVKVYLFEFLNKFLQKKSEATTLAASPSQIYEGLSILQLSLDELAVQACDVAD